MQGKRTCVVMLASMVLAGCFSEQKIFGVNESIWLNLSDNDRQRAIEAYYRQNDRYLAVESQRKIQQRQTAQKQLAYQQKIADQPEQVAQNQQVAPSYTPVQSQKPSFFKRFTNLFSRSQPVEQVIMERTPAPVQGAAQQRVPKPSEQVSRNDAGQSSYPDTKQRSKLEQNKAYQRLFRRSAQNQEEESALEMLRVEQQSNRLSRRPAVSDRDLLERQVEPREKRSLLKRMAGLLSFKKPKQSEIAANNRDRYGSRSLEEPRTMDLPPNDQVNGPRYDNPGISSSSPVKRTLKPGYEDPAQTSRNLYDDFPQGESYNLYEDEYPSVSQYNQQQYRR